MKTKVLESLRSFDTHNVRWEPGRPYPWLFDNSTPLFPLTEKMHTEKYYVFVNFSISGVPCTFRFPKENYVFAYIDH